MYMHVCIYYVLHITLLYVTCAFKYLCESVCINIHIHTYNFWFVKIIVGWRHVLSCLIPALPTEGFTEK